LLDGLITAAFSLIPLLAVVGPSALVAGIVHCLIAAP
jgi:hypothetical protein